MRNYQSRTNADTISTVSSMLLFLLFAGCTLLIIAAAAGTYSRISRNFDKTLGVSASVRYVSNKIRSADSAQIIDDGKGLIIRSGGIVNVIYFENGGLYERSYSIEDEPVPQGGEKIFDLRSVSITMQGEMYRITAAGEEEEIYTLVRG